MRRALILTLVACGAASTQPQLVSKNQVSLVLTGPKIDVPFDPKSARLEEATQQLHALLAHPIAFELDAAIFSESRDKFEEMVLGALEVVTADLAKVQKSAPQAFAHGAPLVDRVILKYDATYDQRELEARIDASTHTLTITGRGGGWSVTPGVVANALTRELEDYGMRHFGASEADAIGPDERAAYFAFLTDWRKRQQWIAAHPRPQTPRVPRVPDSELLRRITRLAALATTDVVLAAEVHKWLFERLPELESAYRNESEVIAALPPAHEWRRAEAAYMTWLSAQVPSATDDERLVIARAVFTQVGGHTPTHSFPGFDRLGFAMSIVDDWTKAGHPSTNIEPATRRSIMVNIVCPIGTRCDHAFYRDVIDSPENIAKLGDALLTRADAKLVETVVAGIAGVPREDKTSALVALSRALGKNDSMWRTMFRSLGDEARELNATVLLEEIRRMWGDQLSRRPILLYTLAWVDRHAPHMVDWEHFATAFGAPATGADLAGMLELSPHAMQVVHRVWPALGKGWSRTQVLAPFLTRFVDGEREPGEADESIRGISRALCEEHATVDIKELVAFFDKRRADHPAERYAKVVTDSSTCRR